MIAFAGGTIKNNKKFIYCTFIIEMLLFRLNSVRTKQFEEKQNEKLLG